MEWSGIANTSEEFTFGFEPRSTIRTLAHVRFKTAQLFAMQLVVEIQAKSSENLLACVHNFKRPSLAFSVSMTRAVGVACRALDQVET